MKRGFEPLTGLSRDLWPTIAFPPRTKGQNLITITDPNERSEIENQLTRISRHFDKIRLLIQWSEYAKPLGVELFGWIIKKASGYKPVIPILVGTPSNLGVEPRRNSPPQNPQDYGKAIQHLITNFGDYFTTVQLWHDPLNPLFWDSTLDPAWFRFSEMIISAGFEASRFHKKALLAVGTIRAEWLKRLERNGVLKYISGIQINGDWAGSRSNWFRLNSGSLEVWARNGQFQAQDPVSTTNSMMGKVSLSQWRASSKSSIASAGGKMPNHSQTNDQTKRVLITGGAGFIGTNLASQLASRGQLVTVFDDFSRPGSEANWNWLSKLYPNRVSLIRGRVQDLKTVESAIAQSFGVFHLAAQAAVTTSLVDPLHDFETNAGGTVRLLECIRRTHRPIPLIFISTNKVYGSLNTLTTEPDNNVQRFRDHPLGIDESQPLNFCTPYGCSKGAGDQYVLDYGRTFQMPALVLRLSCIYGPHQNGTEDQGWVAHFIRRIIDDRPITIFGDGRQVRDILYIDDLLDVLLLAWGQINRLSGLAFNIGGGPERAVNLLQVVNIISQLSGCPAHLEFEPPRPSDQNAYISDTRFFSAETGWIPRTSVQEGIRQLVAWFRTEQHPSSLLAELKRSTKETRPFHLG